MEKVHFTEEKATMLATLYGRAVDARLDRPILGDHAAAEAVDKIDYDWRRFGMNTDAALSVAARAAALDAWTREFLDANPAATVLHLGCGMDTRVYRMDPPPAVRWFDVDYPETVELRERLYPARDGYRMIGSSVTDLGWLGEVPADWPALVVAEGLTMYLDPAKGRALLRALVERFPSGEMAFDVFSRASIATQKINTPVRRSGATLRWGLSGPAELEGLGLTVVDAVSAIDLAGPETIDRFSAAARWSLKVLSRIAFVRNMSHLVRCRF
ncbi:class I SAM-dependent methyltransferase [Amycolatopsis minnesotensis]|uniref:Class I SAM-dependent methyltransferase n=1 Tax=Amycolatopsis minnesotensis TaxID=337894 RepID=A0ABP5BU73_9PSEU